jgi:DegV family protein with EDD domain
VYAAAVSTAERTTTLFYVDTLEHLRRGGRIGAAQALLGTALSVKPILHVREGRIVPLEKVRTVSKGIARLEALAVSAAGDGPADVAVHHLAAAERAALLAERLRTRLPQVRQFYASEVGAVVGAHVGPGSARGGRRPALTTGQAARGPTSGPAISDQAVSGRGFVAPTSRKRACCHGAYPTSRCHVWP